MPRTRSTSTPPPRRSTASDRSRSVRNLTHRPKKVTKKEEKEEVVRALPADPKQRLILQHAEARAERPPSSFGPIGIAAAALTCLVIFAGWWFLPDIGGKPDQVVFAPAPVATTQPQTERETVLAPLQAAVTAASSTSEQVTSTERKLLLPLTSSSSDSLR